MRQGGCRDATLGAMATSDILECQMTCLGRAGDHRAHNSTTPLGTNWGRARWNLFLFFSSSRTLLSGKPVLFEKPRNRVEASVLLCKRTDVKGDRLGEKNKFNFPWKLGWGGRRVRLSCRVSTIVNI